MSINATLRIKPEYLVTPEHLVLHGTQSETTLAIRELESDLRAKMAPRTLVATGSRNRASNRAAFVAQAGRRDRLLALGGVELPVPRFGVVDAETGKRRAMTRAERKRYRRAARSSS